MKDKAPLTKLTRFSSREMMCLKEGTWVRVKGDQYSENYKKGGYLIFQTRDMQEDDERLYGIHAESGVCFHIHANDFEIINHPDNPHFTDATDGREARRNGRGDLPKFKPLPIWEEAS